jgi:hypothetical protein
MFDGAERPIRTIRPGAEMRPRRWYTDEAAPPRRALSLTSELWRYRSLGCRRKKHAAPVIGAASFIGHWQRARGVIDFPLI